MTGTIENYGAKVLVWPEKPGSKIMIPVPGAGLVAMFQDTKGNRIGIWNPV